MKPLIQLSHIFKDYVTGTVVTSVLQDVSFTIYEGEFVIIMGPSGSGKSTLMHILGALDMPTKGIYKLNGKDITSFSDKQLAQIRNREIGFVFQMFHLLGRRSALNNVCLPMYYAGIEKKARVQKAKQLLTMVGLAERETFSSSQLSGGQKQRVAIARALAMNPAIILADEPTGNLASDQGKEIMELFQMLHKQGHTVIVITHEEQIASYAQRLLIIHDGKIVMDKKNKK